MFSQYENARSAAFAYKSWDFVHKKSPKHENVGNLSAGSWEFVYEMLGMCPLNVGILSETFILYCAVVQYYNRSIFVLIHLKQK